MALFQIDYYSTALAKTTGICVILPNDIVPVMVAGNECYQRETKSLYLLHGYSGSSKDWLLGSSIHELAIKYNLAVIMPSGDNSFYLDAKGTGKAYGRFIGQELVEYISRTFGLSQKKEDVYIGGYSMGGFGALHAGLVYPQTFGKIMALSSAMIIQKIKNIPPDYQNAFADYDYYTSVFGDLQKLEESINNPEYLVREGKERGEELPHIFIACGTEDFGIEDNRAFRDFLLEENIDVHYVEAPGMHDWTFWNGCLEQGIQWLIGQCKDK